MYYARNMVRRFFNRQYDVPPAVEEGLATLDPPFRAPLLSMYRGEPQLVDDGEHHAIDPTVKISPSQGMWIYGLCLSVKPKATLEIGMCYGFSSLFLAAIAKNKSGHHTAVDPDVRRTGMASALPMSAFSPSNPSSATSKNPLSAQGSTSHVKAQNSMSFSSTEAIALMMRVDFYLYAPLCGMGGRIIFDDMWIPSIQSAVTFFARIAKILWRAPNPTETSASSRESAKTSASGIIFSRFQRWSTLMTSAVIHCEGLGKSFQRGALQKTMILRDHLARILKSPRSAFRRPKDETFWALKDVFLDVREGEVLVS